MKVRESADELRKAQMADLKKSVRTSLSYFQTVRQRVLTLIKGRRRKSAK